MSTSPPNPYAAGEQGLGYLYQSRLALMRLIELPEDTAVWLEKDDDVDFENNDGTRALASLKHKAPGDRLTNLATDFWKSVRIWLARYDRDGRLNCTLRFFLFTTGQVAPKSYLKLLCEGAPTPRAHTTVVQKMGQALALTQRQDIVAIGTTWATLTPAEQEDFVSRVVVFDAALRITAIPAAFMDRYLRCVPREHREAVFQRLEGWWHNETIDLLARKRTTALSGAEVSLRLARFAAEYTATNLPITFGQALPATDIDVHGDDRLFVQQLREIGLATTAIRRAILDYYRASSQRSAWLRADLLMVGEWDGYEDRLTDEWARRRDRFHAEIDASTAEPALRVAGQRLYAWADEDSGALAHLRIRGDVTEPYILRGGYHLLANQKPVPGVYWHPQWPARLATRLAPS